MKKNSLLLSFFQLSIALLLAIMSKHFGALSWLTSTVFLGVAVFYFLLPKFSNANWSMLIFTLFLNAIASCIFIFWSLVHYIETAKLIIAFFSAISTFKIYFLIRYFYRKEFVVEDQNDGLVRKEFIQALKQSRTNQGDSILEISKNKPILLVFIRHFGCTFCRENVTEISSIENQITQLGYRLVFVHMSDPSYGDEFFARYFNHPVTHIADPSRKIFKAFGLRRGDLMQVFGPMTWIKGLWAGVFKGHGIGEIEGDSLQLGGYFLLKDEQITFMHYFQSASEKFSLKKLIQA